MDIKQLILNCQKNEPKAQGQLYKLFSSKIFTICLKYSRNYEEAQDNLQEGFLYIFSKINQYNFKGSFEGWIKRVMINYILQQYRGAPIFEVVKDNTIVEYEIVLEPEDDVSLDYLLKIIQELPDRYRLVFNLYVLDGYSHKEIASLMDITEGTSKSNLARAKMILKEKIETLSLNNKEYSTK